MELLIKKEELKNLENAQAILFEKSCLGENRKVWLNLTWGTNMDQMSQHKLGVIRQNIGEISWPSKYKLVSMAQGSRKVTSKAIWISWSCPPHHRFRVQGPGRWGRRVQKIYKGKDGTAGQFLTSQPLLPEFQLRAFQLQGPQCQLPPRRATRVHVWAEPCRVIGQDCPEPGKPNF